MRVMYLAYMFHTNQSPIMRGWNESEDEAVFVCYTKGKTENHKYGEPYILGFSKVFYLINSIYSAIHKKRNKYSSFPEEFSGKFGFPPLGKLRKKIRKWRPDIVIIRDRSVYAAVCYLTCKRCGVPTMLYNQTPFYGEKQKKDIKHKLAYTISPKVRMTPVLGKNDGEVTIKNTFYVPFVIFPEISYSSKQYIKNGKINILCVGKYEERKNQLMLLNCIKELRAEYNISLVLAGEVSTEHHKRIYEQICTYIAKNNMQEYVICYTNYEPDKMGNLYQGADLFVLPSTGEFASVSQLEAMAYALPVIVSDTNGTACYIQNGRNGFIFKDNNDVDLKEKIESIICDKQNIIDMGRESYQLVVTEHSFNKYRETIKKIYSIVKD